MLSEVGQFYLGEKLDMLRRLNRECSKVVVLQAKLRERGGRSGDGRTLSLNSTHSKIIERGSIPLSHGVA